jgi:hypothetical protein
MYTLCTILATRSSGMMAAFEVSLYYYVYCIILVLVYTPR